MDNEKQIYTLSIEEDSSGEWFLVFPDELLNQVGWDPGDELTWEEISPTSWLIKKNK